MRKLSLLFIGVTLASCASNPDAKGFLETLEFEGDEYGTITARGNVKVGGLPFFQSEIYLDYTKTKDAPVYEVVE